MAVIPRGVEFHLESGVLLFEPFVYGSRKPSLHLITCAYDKKSFLGVFRSPNEIKHQVTDRRDQSSQSHTRSNFPQINKLIAVCVAALGKRSSLQPSQICHNRKRLLGLYVRKVRAQV